MGCAASTASPDTKEIVCHDIKFSAAVTQPSSDLPHEFAETADYVYVVLEVPGLASLDELGVSCDVANNGYAVALKANRTSAVHEAPISLEEVRNTRMLGDVSWGCHLVGVFEREPEYNVHDGLFKLRFKKLAALRQEIVKGSF